MKKTLLLLAVSIPFFNITIAQVKWGIGGGIHSNSVIEKNNLNSWDQQFKENYSPLSGFHGGIFAEINLDKNGNWAVQPALLYTNKGRKFSKSYDSTTSFLNDTSTINASWKISYAELPVNLVYRVPLTSKLRFVVGGGPRISYHLNSKAVYEIRNASGEYSSFDNKLATGDAVNKYQKLVWGVNALAGLDFNDRVMLTANYSRDMSGFYTAEYGGSFRHELWGAGAVIWFTRSATAKQKAAEKDSDGDGVPDKLDKCPGEMGTAATNGCPDRDGDNIPDTEDSCPDIPGPVQFKGCPAPDGDKDGIPDHEDKCPEVAGLAQYGGCPAPDTDNDGIPDDRDLCPETAGIAKYNGCPVPDTDGDGIDDENDKCPLKPGRKENGGCPMVTTNMLEEITNAARSILFDVSSDNIKTSSYPALNKLAKILELESDINLEIEGHTDNTGSVRLNQVLSGRRALAIKTYLVNKGIAPERLKASGFGSERPIADNNTEAGRAKNRRVEFKVKY